MRRLRLAFARYLSITLLCTVYAHASAADAVNYAYDTLGRLVSATAAGQGVTYRYDAAGNLTAIAANNSPLTITALQPGSGMTGTAVTIGGTGFAALAGDNAVKFNGLSAAVQSASATQIVALVPSGAVSGEVSVTTPAGTTVSPMAFRVDSVGPPTISGFSPAVAAPGSPVAVSGANFDTSAKVFFGAVPSPYRTVSVTSLAVDVPVSAKSGKIEVATINGTARSSDDFFVAPPGLSAADIAVTGRLTFGQPRSVKLVVAGQKAMLLFDGTAGQKVSLQIGPSTITSASVSILAPGNATVASSSFNTAGGFVDALILPVSGTYAVLINPSGTAVGKPDITLYTFVDVSSGLIPGGATAQVTTTVPGQNALLTFSGSAGQRISALVSGVAVTGEKYLYMSLRKPDGSVMVDSAFVPSSGAFLDTQTLPASGTYTLLLNPAESSLAKATIQLYDVPADLSIPATVGGAPVQIATTVPGQNAAIVFNGVAGQRISTLVNDVSFTSGDYLYMSLSKPDGGVMTNSAFVPSSGAFLDTQTLPASGTYTLLLNPAESSLAKATILLYDMPADLSVPATVGGVPVQIATTVPGQNAAVVFNGVAGQRISALVNGVSFTGGSYLYMSLRKPDGSVMINSALVLSNGAFLDTQTLPVSGTYTLLLNPAESSLAKATIQLYNVPADLSVPAIVGGAPVQIATTIPGQNAAVVFNGVAGQRISTLVNGVSFTGDGYLYMSLSKPDSSAMVGVYVPSNGAFLDTQTLPVSGTYTLLLNPAESSLVSATIQLYNVPTDLSVPAAVGGAPVQIATTVPGQNAAVVFNGVAGQRISALVNGVSLTGGDYLYMSLSKPDGGAMVGVYVPSNGSFLDTQTLSVSGTYTLLLNPAASSLVKATIQLYVPADPSVPATVGGPPVQVSSTAPGKNAAIVFNGVAGQRISALVNDVSFIGGSYLYMSLRKPDGGVMVDSVYVSSSGTFLDTLTLPVSGTYTLLLNPTESSSVKATIQLYVVPADPSVPATVGGAPVQVASTAPGQNAAIVFNGVAGQRISALVNDVSFIGGSYLYMSLRKPDGSVMVDSVRVSSGGAFLSMQTLPVSGNYKLLLNPQASALAKATVQLYDVPADLSIPATAGGAPVQVESTALGQNAAILFNGVAGQRISALVNGMSLTGGSYLEMSLRKPNGSVMADSVYVTSSGAFLDTQTLPVSGTYSLRLDPREAAMGQAKVQLFDVPMVAPMTAAIDGTAATITTTIPGQNASLKFNGSAGQTVTIAATANTMGCVHLALRKPDGSAQTTRLICSASTTITPLALSASGDYFIDINANGANVGAINIRITSP